MLLLRIPTTAVVAAARGTRSLSSSSSSCASRRTHSKCPITVLSWESSSCGNSIHLTTSNSNNNNTRRHLSFSRMLDMGGAPSAMHDKSSSIKIQTSKNCKVQAICFDFEVLTNSLTTAAEEASSSTSTLSLSSPQPVTNSSGTIVQPDVNMIQQVASLLNVKLEGESGEIKKSSTGAGGGDDDNANDDLSLLLGERKKSKENSSRNKTSNSAGPLAPDIRQKYANKLFQRGVEGGVASVELAKYQVQETLKKGDAAGHLAARKMVASEPVGSSSSSSSSGNRWMAQTGTGALLQYLSQRSLKLGLLPRPGLVDNDKRNNDEQQGQRMQNFQKQLPDVTFDVMMLDLQEQGDGSLALDAQTIVAKTLQQLKLTSQPERVLLVSDRDDYLKAAKEAGMVACRIRLPTARRGNVSTHYMVSSIPEVQEVVNEINGISYKAVLNGR